MNKLFKILTICLCFGLITSSATFANVEFEEKELEEDGLHGILRVDGQNFLKADDITVPNGPTTYKVSHSTNKTDWNLLYNTYGENYDAAFRFTRAISSNNVYYQTMEGEVIKTENGYLARTTRYDDGYVPRYDTETIIRSNIIFLDNNFNAIDMKELDSYINALSYENGVYYIRKYMGYFGAQTESLVTEVKYFCSTDFENWVECDGMPLENEGHKIYISSPITMLTRKPALNETGKKYYPLTWDLKNGEASTIKNGNPDCKVAYEAFEISNIRKAGGFFVGELSYENEKTAGKIALSKDGIYFTVINFPNDGRYRFRNAYELEGDGISFWMENIIWNTGMKLYKCKLSDLENEVRTGDIYVRYGDKILGFETPPVMENDRTLVPMRFLFEQMGASVDWNPETESATATLSNNAVTFSIDNNDASVNNQIVTMDVPARLINDKTMVPLRFLSENLGYTVTWDEETNTAIIE